MKRQILFPGLLALLSVLRCVALDTTKCAATSYTRRLRTAPVAFGAVLVATQALRAISELSVRSAIADAFIVTRES